MSKQAPHLVVAILSSAAMAMALAAGFTILGIMQLINDQIVHLFTITQTSHLVKILDPTMIWTASTAFSLILPTVILNIPGAWRRWTFWIFSLALILTWAPVLCLAAHQPHIAVPLLVVFWSGFCAMIYTINHTLPVDQIDANPQRSHHEKS